VMIRFCPKCKAKLGSYDYFYCSGCGAQLPENLINTERSHARVADFASGRENQLHFGEYVKTSLKRAGEILNIKLVALICIGFLLGGFAVNYLLRNFYYPPLKLLTTETSVPVYKNVLTIPVVWQAHVFGADKIADYVPFDVTAYVEGNDLKMFVKALRWLDPAYREIADRLEGNYSAHFAFFATSINGEQSWSLVFFPLSGSFSIPRDFGEKYQWLKYEKIDQAFVLTTQQSVLDKVKETNAKTAKGIVHQQSYAMAKALLPKSGKLLVVFIDPGMKAYFSALADREDLSADLKTIINGINGSGFDYLVVQ
jgi:hypothetical protein